LSSFRKIPFWLPNPVPYQAASSRLSRMVVSYCTAQDAASGLNNEYGEARNSIPPKNKTEG
jgi:hypothetical protein